MSTQNYKKAFEWYEKAAHQGLAPAQFNLGVMYKKGQAVPQNYIYAYSWVNLAVLNGFKDVIKLKTHLASAMSFNQLTMAQTFSKRKEEEITQTHSFPNFKKVQ